MSRPCPVVLCGNKVDTPYRRLGPRLITFHREHGLWYYDISAQTGVNLPKVFLQIAKATLGNQDLVCLRTCLSTYLAPDHYHLVLVE